MFAVASHVDSVDPVVGDRSGTGGGLPRNAKPFLFAVLAAAAVVSASYFDRISLDKQGWAPFLILSASAAVAQLFVVHTPRNQSYHTAIVFVIPAVLLLPPELLLLMGIVQHVPEWLKMRYPWYIPGFNVANYTLNALAAQGVARAILALDVGSSEVRFALAGLVACTVFVVLNHALLAVMLHLARGHGLRATGLFSVESLSTDIILGSLGVTLAGFWNSNPWLVLTAVAPLILIHRSLSVPALQEEARIDPKTGLFNARHFASELQEQLDRAIRFERPLSVIMADLDHLRDVNNTYGHLAGDAVLRGVAAALRRELRHFDVPARFGGEEFAILLPETTREDAVAIAERIRRAVAETPFESEAWGEPIRATVSLGVASFPSDATHANGLVHQADLAVYRAKLQGRNRVLGASREPLVMSAERSAHLTIALEDGDQVAPLQDALPTIPPAEPRAGSRPHMPQAPRLLSLSPLLAALVAVVGLAGIVGGALGLLWGGSEDIVGLVAVVALVAGGQAFALELEGGSISVSAVGVIAGTCLFGYRAALPLALAAAAVEWSTRRSAVYQLVFNIGALSLASLAAGEIFRLSSGDWGTSVLAIACAGVLAGGAYFLVNTGLLSSAIALEGQESLRAVWNERFSWLLPHYIVFGAVAAGITLAYDAMGLYGLAVFGLPLLLMRKTMGDYLDHTRKSAQKLRQAARTIQSQNVLLERANHLLRERSTAAMESLSATVDARDSYTAGHSRRVQGLALAIGRELGLSKEELDLLGQAALFHDIGKLAIPDAILLKPASLTDEEWAVVRRHSEEGAHIIDRLGFLGDAVPAIRHHHENYDGTGYPDGLAGEEIPLGARIIHLVDALDSMVGTRVYRSARPLTYALVELWRNTGTQFCPRCMAALQRVLEREAPEHEALAERTPRLRAVS